MPFSNDPFNDPNRIARRMAQQASDNAQRASRHAMEQSQRAAAQAAETSRRFAEQNRQAMLRDQQARQQRASTEGLQRSDGTLPEAAPSALPEETKRGGSKGFVLFLLVIGALAILGIMALG